MLREESKNTGFPTPITKKEGMAGGGGSLKGYTSTLGKKSHRIIDDANLGIAGSAS